MADELLNLEMSEHDTISLDIGKDDEVLITHNRSGKGKKKKEPKAAEAKDENKED